MISFLEIVLGVISYCSLGFFISFLILRKNEDNKRQNKDWHRFELFEIIFMTLLWPLVAIIIPIGSLFIFITNKVVHYAEKPPLTATEKYNKKIGKLVK